MIPACDWLKDKATSQTHVVQSAAAISHHCRVTVKTARLLSGSDVQTCVPLADTWRTLRDGRRPAGVHSGAATPQGSGQSRGGAGVNPKP
jgi:hypothetical protein